MDIIFRMSFKFDFSPSESGSSSRSITATSRKRRQPSPIGLPQRVYLSSSSSESSIEPAPLVKTIEGLTEKDLPILNPRKQSIWMPYGKSADIWVGLRKMDYVKPVKISRDAEMVNEAMVTINKAIILMTRMVRDVYINWNEWSAVSKIISDLIPECSHQGVTIRSAAAWRSFKSNIYRSNRRTTWVRLVNALQLMGNELAETKVLANKAINEIYAWLLAHKVQAHMLPEWRGSMNTKPEKIERNGFHYSFATRK